VLPSPAAPAHIENPKIAGPKPKMRANARHKQKMGAKPIPQKAQGV
jgi:hypothetical protein